MLSRRVAAAFIVFIAVFSATLAILPYVARAEGTVSDKMCTPWHEECGCGMEPNPAAKTDPKAPKCIKGANTNKCEEGICFDDTNDHYVTGICVAKLKCKALHCDGKACGGQTNDSKSDTPAAPQTGQTPAEPKPDGAGGPTPNLPQPPGGGDSGGTPKPDPNAMPKTDPLGNPLGEPLPEEKTPEKTPETNSFGEQLKQAQQSSGFLNTIENYFNPPDPLGPNSSGVSAFSPESVTQGGSNAFGDTPSLYDQAVNPIGESTGFTPTPSTEPAPQSWIDYMRNTATDIGTSLSNAYDAASTIASEAYTAVSDAAKSAGDYIAQATGFGDTTPTGAQTNEFLNGTTPPDEFAGNDPNDLTPATNNQPSGFQDEVTEISPENKAAQDAITAEREKQADIETAAHEQALKDAENKIPKPEQFYTDAQQQVEKTNLAENLKEMGGGPPLDPAVAEKLSRLEIAKEELNNAQADFEKQLQTAKTAEAKLQELNDKFNERWAPYRQCQDVCSNMDTTYDVRDAKEQAEFRQMQQELIDQQKLTSGEYAKAQDLLDNYKLTDQEIQGLEDDKEVGDFLKQQSVKIDNEVKIAERQDYAERLKADIEKNTEKIVNGFGFNKDCWGTCKAVEITNADGSVTTKPLSEYLRDNNNILFETNKDIERLQARADFFNSNDPLAAKAAQTIADGGYRGALAEGALDKMLAEKPLADAARNGDYYHDPDAITRESDRRAQLERLSNGEPLTPLEQEAYRKSQGMTEEEVKQADRLRELGNGTIRAINDAGRLSGPISNLTAAEAQSRLFMSDSEVFQQQKSAWGEAGLRVGLDAANLALLPTGMAQGVTAIEAAYLGGRDLVATGITSSLAGAGERSFFAESAAGREAFYESQVAQRSATLSQMESDFARGVNGVTEGQIMATRSELGLYEARLAEARGTVAADTTAFTGTEARLTADVTTDAAVQTEARVATEFNAARVESEMKAVETATEQKISQYTVTEQQMKELTQPLVAADTPATAAERAAIERYNTTASEYARTQQLIAQGNLAQDSALARAAQSDYLAAGRELREAGLMERPGAISDTQHGLDNVYRANSGEVLASRANSYGLPSSYEVAGSRVADVPIVDTPSVAPATQAPSVFDRVAEPFRDFFGGSRASESSFVRPAFDTTPQTFTQTLERNVQDFFRLAEPAPAGSLTVAEARAMETFNSALAERTLPIPSTATEAGQALVASQRADALTRAIAGLAAEGLYQRADGPIVRSNGEIVATQLPIQIPGQSPYAITAPIETAVRDLAVAQNATLPSRVDTTPTDTSGAANPARQQSITTPQERGLLPGETVSPQIALQRSLAAPFALGLLASLFNTTPAAAGSPSFNTCVAQMCLRPITGPVSYYDPRNGGMNVDWSAVKNGMALTKSGEPVSMNRGTNIDEHMTIASQRYPVNTIVRLCNGSACTFVRVNDTGSFEKYGRVGDLMPGPAKAIGFNIAKGVNTLTQYPVVAISGANGNHQTLVNGIADGVLRDLNQGTPLTQALDNAAARSRNLFTYTLPQSNVAYVATPGSAPGTQLAKAIGEQTAPVTTAVTAPATEQVPVPNNTLTQAAKLGGRPQIPGVEKMVYLTNLDLVPASKWKNIVIHQTEGPAGQAASLAQQQLMRPGKTGTTIYVETDGTVYWATPETTSPSHILGNRTDNAYLSNTAIRGQLNNQNSIGIEFTGNYPDVAKPLTDAQMKAGEALIKFLQERYNIRADNVYAHNWIDFKDTRYNEGAQLATQMRTLAYVPGQATQGAGSVTTAPVPSTPAPDFETRLREALEKQNAELAKQQANKPALTVTEELERRLAAKSQQELDQTSRATRPAPTAAPAATRSWTPINFAPAPITQPYVSSPPKTLNLPPAAEPAPVDLSDIALVPKAEPVADIQPTVSHTVQKPPVLVDGAVNVPPVNAIDPAPVQQRLEIARADVQKAQAQVDAIQNQLTPLMKKLNEVSKQELVIETAEKNLASMNTGRVLLNSINGQPNPAQMATLRASAGGASRLSNNVKQLGDAGLASELRGYVNLLNWLAKPENQTKANADLAKSTGNGLINRAQRVIDQATARADAVGDSDVLAKQQKALLAELSTASKNLSALKNIEQSTASQLSQTPGVTIKQVEPAPEAVPTAPAPAETTIVVAEPAPEAVVVEETPKFVRAPEEEQKLTLPPDFSPTFTQFPYDSIGNPPVYEIPNPIVLKGTLTAALGAYTYLPASIRDVLADVTLETKSISFTKDELDAIQWGKMDKNAYQFVLRQFNHDPTLQTGYVPPVASSDRVAGPQLFVDMKTNANGGVPDTAVAAAPEETAPVTTPVTAPPTTQVDVPVPTTAGTVPATMPTDVVAQPSQVEKFFTRLASGEQVTQTLGKGLSYTYQWAKEKLFGADPTIQVGKLTTAPYEAPVPTGSTARYVCAGDGACSRGSASGLFVSTEPGRTYAQVAVEGTLPVDTRAVIDAMKQKGVQPVMNAAGPFVTSVKNGQAVQDIAYNKGVSVGANVSATGRDGLVITNSDGKMMIANKRDLRLGDFEQVGVRVMPEMADTRLNIVGSEDDLKQFDAIMKDHQLSAITNLLLVENGKLNPAVNDRYTSRRLLVVMPDGTTGILSSVENARTNDFAKVAQSMGAKYAVNLDTGFYDEATVHLQDGTAKSIGTAGSDNHAHGVIAIGVKPDTAPVQRTDVVPTTNVTVDSPTPEQTAPVTTPVTAPAETPVPNQPQITETPNAIRPNEIEVPVPKPNISGALPPPEPNQLSAVVETQAPKPNTSGSVVPTETAGVPRPNETGSPSAQTPRPNTTIDDFSVTEIMPDGSVRTLRPDVTTPGGGVPANRGGGGGIVPPVDPTWRPYFEPPVPGQYIGPTSNLPWWTIGSIGGIAATLTTIAMLSPDDHPSTSAPVETAHPADETAPVTTPVTAKPDEKSTPTEEKTEPPCTERANTRDNMLRKLLGDSLSEVDCVPTPPNILNNEPLPRIPDLKPIEPPTTTKPPTTTTPPPGTVPPGTTRPPGTVPPGTGGGAPTGVPGAPTGGTNAGSNSSMFGKLMSFLGGFIKGFGGSMLQNAQQPQPQQPANPIPNAPQPNGTTTPISVQITVSPNPAHTGDSVRLSWASLSATVCRATDSNGIHMATGTPDSAVMFTAPAQTSAYYIACTNARGAVATGSVTLIVR